MSLLLPLLAAIAGPAQAGRVTGVEVDDKQIVVRFDDVVERATSLVLESPHRIALDVTGVEGKGPVVPSHVRQSSSARTTRIVFDMTRPTAVSTGGFSSDGRSLILKLATIDGDAVSDAAAAPQQLYLPPKARATKPPRSRYSITVPLRAAVGRVPLPKVAGPDGRPLVVIDAGHGGHDPGAVTREGLREKDLTLALAKVIRDELVAGGRVRVALTREDDRYLILGERSAVARRLNADLFISVHADSAPNTSAQGATIYTLSEVASDRTAAQLAARENRADIINGVNLRTESSDVSSILIDLAQRETMNASARFAALIRREGAGVPFKPDYHRMAGFAVLKAPDTPAILLEAGYLTNAIDVERISSPAGRRAIAIAIRRATDVQFARRVASR